MKILCTLDFPPEKGGIQRYLHELVYNSFCKEDIVVAPHIRNSTTAKDTVYSCRIMRMRGAIPVHSKKRYLPVICAALLYLILRNGSTATILSGNIYAAIAPWLLSFLTKVTYSVYTHGAELLPLEKNTTLRGRLLMSILKRAETVFYVSTFSLRIMQSKCGSLRYIAAPPKISLPSKTLDSVLSSKQDGLILSVGRLVPHKGHAVLIDALHKIDSCIPWKCMISGDGPEQKRLNQLIAQYHFKSPPSLLGFCDQETLESWYLKSAIFIFPSLILPGGFEGFGIALLEAMAFGAAIIASHSGGIPEVFDNTPDCALLVPPDDPEALAAAISSLLVNKHYRLTLATNARRLLEQKHVWPCRKT